MPRNFGQMTMTTVTIDGNPRGIPYSVDGVPWRDHTNGSKTGCIYLVVEKDGNILAAGPDPFWNLIAGFDVWEVEGTDWKAVVGKQWNGSEIV